MLIRYSTVLELFLLLFSKILLLFQILHTDDAQYDLFDAQASNYYYHDSIFFCLKISEALIQLKNFVL